jgi:hypothetical protein
MIFDPIIYLHHLIFLSKNFKNFALTTKYQ